MNIRCILLWSRCSLGTGVCDWFLLAVIELIAESLNSLLRGLMVPMVIILARRSWSTRRCLSCRTPNWTCVKWSLVTLIYLGLFRISWSACLWDFWGTRIVIWLFYDVWWTLVMLILLSKRCYLLSLCFKTLKSDIRVYIFFIFESCFRSLCYSWFSHHWWFRRKTLDCIISSRNTVILWRVNIWLPWRGTRWRDSNLSFFLFLIFSWS